MLDYKGRVEGIFNNLAQAYDDFVEKLMTLDADLLIRDLQIPYISNPEF